MIAFLTSSRFGLCDYEMEQLCQLYLPASASEKNSWFVVAHVLTPFLRRSVVGGLSLVTWRDAAVRDEMHRTFLVDAQAIHWQMLDYYQNIWQQARASLQRRALVDLFSPSLAHISLRYRRNEFKSNPSSTDCVCRCNAQTGETSPG